MNAKFSIYTTKKQSRIMLRLYKRDFDVSVALELSVSPEDWDQENQCFKNNQVVNTKLLELKLAVLNQYNLDYVQGLLIDKSWLQKTISECFGRPSQEHGLKNLDYMIYLSDFSKHWLETKADKWKTGPNKYMSSDLKGQYSNFVKLLVKFEQMSSKIIMKDLNSDQLYDFVNWMMEENFSPSKVDRDMNRLKFFLNRAIEDGIRISNDCFKRLYIDKNQGDTEEVYLNEKELSDVFNLDLSHDYNLEAARDNLIISAYTGLRFSDFMTNLNTDNIKDGFISIKTRKTGIQVKLPAHNYIRTILNKRFGQLPKKTTATEYNKQIKTVCMLAGIDGQVYGKKWDPISGRKVAGYFKKFEMISSHCGRKSFASNLSGKVSDEIIMSCAGWSSQSMKDHYNKTSKTEYANKLNEYWNG